jgi:hypothetical protein
MVRFIGVQSVTVTVWCRARVGDRLSFRCISLLFVLVPFLSTCLPDLVIFAIIRGLHQSIKQGIEEEMGQLYSLSFLFLI